MIRSAPHIAIGVLALACGAAAAQTAHPKLPSPPPPPVRAQANPADTTFAAWDTDHNGSLSPQEFRDGWQRTRQTVQGQARLRQQFAAVDINKNGAIDASEYASLLLVKNAGKSAPPLARFDANKDGKLQLAEYLMLVQALAPGQTRQRQGKTSQ